MLALTKIVFALLFALQLPQNDASAIAHRGEIWPHPRDPEHLQKVLVNVAAVERNTFLWWSWETRASGALSIQEARPRGGWWISAARELDVDGKWSGEVMLDPTLRPGDNVVLILLMDGRQQIGQVEIHAGDLSRGVSGKIVVEAR